MANELTYQKIGDGAEFAQAWDELCAILRANPEWELAAGFYRTNGGDFGMYLRHKARPSAPDIWATASGTLTDVVRAAAGDLMRAVVRDAHNQRVEGKRND